MKLIVAVIRPEKLNDVLEALFEADVRGITVSRVVLLSTEMKSSSFAPGVTEGSTANWFMRVRWPVATSMRSRR